MIISVRASLSGATSVRRPISFASRAGTRFPNMTMSFARVIPMSRTTRALPPEPGICPIADSGRPTSASSVAKRKSQARHNSKPTPKAYFSMAAMTGFEHRSGAPILSARSDIFVLGISGNFFTSPPEENTSLAPRIIMTPTSSSSSKDSMMARICARPLNETIFSGGRSRIR